jgi:hypothetical protein
MTNDEESLQLLREIRDACVQVMRDQQASITESKAENEKRWKDFLSALRYQTTKLAIWVIVAVLIVLWYFAAPHR